MYNMHPYFALHFEERKKAENGGSGYAKLV